jgi:mannose-6-phosphate isomerase
VHPDATVAARLHAERPDVYGDPHAKPEMAIALSETFRAMVGLRPTEEVRAHVAAVPELATLAGTTAEDATTASVFEAIARADSATATPLLAAFVARTTATPSSDAAIARLEAEVRRIAVHFPGDPGAFAVFVLNVVDLARGEAIFLGANVPHAYLSGDCVECMAMSDNVVRAGLTPKLRDVDTLLAIVDFTQTGGEDLYRVSPLSLPGGGFRYEPLDEQVRQFSVDLFTNFSGPLPPVDGPSILLVVRAGEGASLTFTGEGGEEKTTVQPGSAFFVDGGSPVTAHDVTYLVRAMARQA